MPTDTLQEQLSALEVLSSSRETLDPSQIAGFLNPALLSRAATIRRHQAVKATAVALLNDTSKLQDDLSRRRKDIATLRREIESIRKETPFPAQRSESELLARFNAPLAMIANNYLRDLGVGPPHQVHSVLVRLIILATGNEWMVAPVSAPITKFLVAENLVRTESAGKGMIRIKLW